MDNLLLTGILGGGALILIGLLIIRSRRIDLDSVPEGETPDWIRSEIPEETIEATREDGEGIALFDHDPGERLAAPFAEQIEDILRSILKDDPLLSNLQVDFGTAPDGGLEFIIGGITYLALDQIPEEGVREVIQKAIDKYNQLD